MRQLHTRWSWGLVFLLTATSAWGQGQGGSSTPTTPPPTPGSSGPRTPSRTPTRPQDRMQGPLFVTGRVLTETGRPAPESLSIELNCGLRPLQVIHSDLGGYFTFSLGTGMQGNMDFSASSEGPASFGSNQNNFPRIGNGNSLSGCELRLAVAGYYPLNYTLTQNTDMGRIDVGTLQLRRVGGIKGSAISVTSLLVPGDARKEFEKALKEIEKNRPDRAQPFLEKALRIYDKYAAAWNEMGRVHLSKGEKEQATQAFEKAVVADPEYIPPYVNLATLQLQNREWEAAVETAEKILELDPSINYASFIQAVGNYNLQHLEEAEQSALEAEKGPHENIPQLHALLAEIFLQKHDYPRALTHMRTYLEESPQGQFAAQMKERLEEVEGLAGDGAAATGETVAAEPER